MAGNTYGGSARSSEGDLIAIADGSCRPGGSPNATVRRYTGSLVNLVYGFLERIVVDKYDKY